MSTPPNNHPDYSRSPEANETRAIPIIQPATGNDPAEIRAEMQQTRAELSETINAIQDRLDPEHLKQQVTDNVRETIMEKAEQVRTRVDEVAQHAMSSLREAQASLEETIRRDPIPSALVGGALALLVFSALTTRRPRSSQIHIT